MRVRPAVIHVFATLSSSNPVIRTSRCADFSKDFQSPILLHQCFFAYTSSATSANVLHPRLPLCPGTARHFGSTAVIVTLHPHTAPQRSHSQCNLLTYLDPSRSSTGTHRAPHSRPPTSRTYSGNWGLRGLTRGGVRKQSVIKRTVSISRSPAAPKSSVSSNKTTPRGG